MHRLRRLACLAFVALAAAVPAAWSRPVGFSMAQVLDYPYPSGLVASQDGKWIAWVINLRGARNVWAASTPAFVPRQLTHFDQDDGQEIGQLTFAPSGDRLVFVRGGDHDANWPAADDLAPDPAANPEQPKVKLWAAALPGGAPVEITEGDAPAISAQGRLAYIKDDQVWSVPLPGPDERKNQSKPKATRLFFDRGKDRSLRWSPDGRQLAFVSDREDHSFIGLYVDAHTPLRYLAPSTGLDDMPRWSPDSTRIAFVRQPGNGGAPRPILTQTPQPWSIWIADAASGQGHALWHSPDTLPGSYPQTAGEANLDWVAGARLIFLADLDAWPHLYSIASGGGAPLLLTPGNFMVEHVALSPDHRAVIYNANTGASANDQDRRHLFTVPVDRAAPAAMTPGDGLQWQPVAAGAGRVAYIDAAATRPPMVALVGTDGRGQHLLQPGLLPKDFPTTQLVVPTAVTFTAADGQLIHGQLFQRNDGDGAKPGIVFVHGGPPRQMLLGWHYMDYYANSYAVNQYLASRGFVVLSVNYRLGIGYGHAFHQPPHWGPTGAAEYQDVVAGAHFLQSTAGVDPKRLGIWGGSYGGYLTGLALARNSDLFKAGVDLHGIHDWSRLLDAEFGKAVPRYEKGDREQALKVAWQSSPDADIAHWTSPVLLIQGDDDRNVHFLQMVDVVQRLQKQHVPFEQLVLPDEIHGFLRHRSWLQADQATADFLSSRLLGERDVSR